MFENVDYLKELLAKWEHELNTDEQGMAHMAVNRVFCLKKKLKEIGK